MSRNGTKKGSRGAEGNREKMKGQGEEEEEEEEEPGHVCYCTKGRKREGGLHASVATLMPPSPPANIHSHASTALPSLTYLFEIPACWWNACAGHRRPGVDEP
jgi:hypothetical protein